MGIPDWWYDSRSGGGWLRNLCLRHIDAIRYALNEFEAVSTDLSFGTAQPGRFQFTQISRFKPRI
jgi:hypothetical protein